MNEEKHHISNRYQRQISLKGFGKTGQDKLSDSRVLVVGVGGLGCAALQYLAAAGTGTIGLLDFDVVQVSNLHRQVLFMENDLGKSKTAVARERLKQQNSEINLVEYNLRLTTENCLEIFEEYELILDGTDNFSTRYMINDACVLLGKPLIMGAISEYQGQVSIFNADGRSSVNYRDLFPQPPQANEILNCAEAGVLGILPGIIGVQMASEAIKLITGIGSPLINRLFTYDALSNETMVFSLDKNAESDAVIPANREVFRQTDYQWLCGESGGEPEITEEDFLHLIGEEGVQCIDVREYGEEPLPESFEYIQIPLSQLKERKNEITGSVLLLFCQSGIRSKKAVDMLKDANLPGRKLYSLAGGIAKATTLLKSSHENTQH